MSTHQAHAQLAEAVGSELAALIQSQASSEELKVLQVSLLSYLIIIPIHYIIDANGHHELSQKVGSVSQQRLCKENFAIIPPSFSECGWNCDNFIPLV